jgi:hypothetical protein
VTKRAAFTLAGDLVDVLTIHFSRIEALSEAILLMEENERDQEKIGYLSDMIGNEAHRGKQELSEWFDNFTVEGA